MKKFALIVFCFSMFSVSLMAQTKGTINNTKTKAVKTALVQKPETKPVDGPNMNLETTVMDYGTIVQDSDPYRYFNFVNDGTEPLVIKHAKGSCGCTVPDYPKEPIMPGETSQIKVRYATNRLNKFTKTITLTTNEGDDVKGMKRVLTIKGEVLPKPAEPEAVPKSAPSIFSPGK